MQLKNSYKIQLPLEGKRTADRQLIEPASNRRSSPLLEPWLDLWLGPLRQLLIWNELRIDSLENFWDDANSMNRCKVKKLWQSNSCSLRPLILKTCRSIKGENNNQMEIQKVIVQLWSQSQHHIMFDVWSTHSLSIISFPPFLSPIKQSVHFDSESIAILRQFRSRIDCHYIASIFSIVN